MGVEIAITVAREETRVAVLDNGVVTDLFGDRAKHKDFVGNIYKGKVAKVLPGMQAAFVDIGLEKAAFMHVSDLSLDAEPSDTLLDSDEDDKDGDEMRPRRESSKPIEQLLTEGQELMVQISKGPIGTKGPRVTTYVSLPGRYLVFMPNVEHIGVSRRIARDEERARLKDIMKRVRHPGCGYIVRTVSEGVKEDELRSDVDFLHVLWQDIRTKRDQQPAPALRHTDLSLSFRVVRDHHAAQPAELEAQALDRDAGIAMQAFLEPAADAVEGFDLLVASRVGRTGQSDQKLQGHDRILLLAQALQRVRQVRLALLAQVPGVLLEPAEVFTYQPHLSMPPGESRAAGARLPRRDRTTGRTLCATSRRSPGRRGLLVRVRPGDRT